MHEWPPVRVWQVDPTIFSHLSGLNFALGASYEFELTFFGQAAGGRCVGRSRHGNPKKKDDSAGFKEGPGDDDDDWKFIRSKIVGDDGSVNYAGVEMVSGHHFQHVANDALQQDMFDAVVNDNTVHPATRAHFHATRQLGAGAVLGIDLISPATELHDRAWPYEAQGYLNHPTHKRNFFRFFFRAAKECLRSQQRR